MKLPVYLFNFLFYGKSLSLVAFGLLIYVEKKTKKTGTNM